jgi:hypothetical protein
MVPIHITSETTSNSSHQHLKPRSICVLWISPTRASRPFYFGQRLSSIGGGGDCARQRLDLSGDHFVEGGFRVPVEQNIVNTFAHFQDKAAPHPTVHGAPISRDLVHPIEWLGVDAVSFDQTVKVVSLASKKNRLAISRYMSLRTTPRRSC